MLHCHDIEVLMCRFTNVKKKHVQLALILPIWTGQTCNHFTLVGIWYYYVSSTLSAPNNKIFLDGLEGGCLICIMYGMSALTIWCIWMFPTAVAATGAFSAYASYVFSFASCGKVTVKIDGKYFRTYLAIGRNGWATK